MPEYREVCSPCDLPWVLVLWVTTDCNLRCRYCYAGGGDVRTYMGWEVARRAIDLFAELSCRLRVQFAGGEPLLNLDTIEQTVAYSADLGLDATFHLQTNATLITHGIASRLKDLGLHVGVSMDGPPHINDTLRPFADGSGSTKATVAGIGHLRDAGIRVGLTCVLSAQSTSGLSSLLDLAGYLGNVQGISLDPLRPVGRGRMEMRPDPSQAAMSLDAAIRHSDELARMGGRRVGFREIERMRYLISSRRPRLHRCYFHACRSLMVGPGGDAYPCASLCLREFYLGSILDRGFEDQLQEKLFSASMSIEMPAECRGCSRRWLCGGPCPAGIYSTGGDMRLECAIRRVFMEHAMRYEGQA